MLNRFDPAKLSNSALLLLLGGLILVSFFSYAIVEFGTIGLCYAIGARLVHERHQLRLFWMSIIVIVQYVIELDFLITSHPVVSIEKLPIVGVLLAIVFITNLAVFLKYNFRTFEIKNSRLNAIVVNISRYSLDIYFFHLMAFMILAYVWNAAV